ncbi:helix-turn-helix domain-containing protein [Microcoleus sp. B3-D7]|uniref:helix-turn-helix domain-containing protein n=1 Tax=Microcoleus sp. B3-D7 TaxID=2818659 RepID=UPI00403F6DEF
MILTIGERIKILRDRKQVTQESFAKSVGRSLSIVCRVETNDRELTYSEIFVWAKALGVEPESLILNTIPGCDQRSPRQVCNNHG